MYRDYLQKKPTDRFAMYSLALELKKAGQVGEAEAAFRALLAIHPDSGAGHLQLGTLLEEDGREDDAQAAWEAGLTALKGLTDPDALRSRSEIQTALDLL